MIVHCGAPAATRCTRRRLRANACDLECVADYGASRKYCKKLSTSAVVVSKKLRRLSSVGNTVRR
jgi:hypothetical protein